MDLSVSPLGKTLLIGEAGSLAAVTTALAGTLVPTPLAMTVPALGLLVEGMLGDPMPWYHANDSWSQIRGVVEAAQGDVGRLSAAIGAAAWSGDGAGQFKQYASAFGADLSALANLTDTMATTTNEIFEGFLGSHITFLVTSLIALAEAIAASADPEPASQTLLKTLIAGGWLVFVGGLIGAIITYLNLVAGQADSIRSSLDQLKGLLHDKFDNLDAGMVALDPQRLKALGDPGQWKLDGIPDSLLH